MPSSIWTRKRDLVYLIYFIVALPIVFIMDCQAIYPPQSTPAVLTSLKEFYIRNYNDQFYVKTPQFFKTFLWFELLYQAPAMAWGIQGLYKDSPKVPLVLLPFSVKVFLTTLTCMLEFPGWNIPNQQKITLCTLYGPYLLLSAFMMGDMYLRLNTIINKLMASQNEGTKKSQ
ncbi:hypothetical protein GLAREA_12586 [Glarea lozoyensis ATCC 20868]|uniref:Efficient mitochondria targeting-associated protein 19 n=1 Tax=Glarea lozoyensis (strain ATCC 20868 / MF5171) TaxID=1116229 RepID=S3DY82_GLAL2|nr:uncharacterized protein GLAREA_12586 [Glarea lozoyensis ATCC 20868]EPE31283.1 hypothetical protein GLAREA_12586 [Glarea lozoyensis ATCC 20868]